MLRNFAWGVTNFSGSAYQYFGEKLTCRCHCKHLSLWEAGMQKKIDQQCHCEGAVGDCGNLNPHNMKTVYFLRSIQPDSRQICKKHTISFLEVRRSRVRQSQRHAGDCHSLFQRPRNDILRMFSKSINSKSSMPADEPLFQGRCHRLCRLS